MTKRYETKEVNDWNTTDFRDYMTDLHLDTFGISYQPMGSWGSEMGKLGTFIGTAKKEGEVSKEVAKRFIDTQFKEYTPSRDYPGLSFGFIYTYKKWEIQKAELSLKRDREVEEVNTNDFNKFKELL